MNEQREDIRDGPGLVRGWPPPRGQRAVLGLPEGRGKARARDALRLALARRNLLIADLAAAARAVTAADERRWDKEHAIEDRMAAAEKRRGAGMAPVRRPSSSRA